MKILYFSWIVSFYGALLMRYLNLFSGVYRLVLFGNIIFLPGFLVLKIVRVSKRTSTKFLTYSIGTSLFFLGSLGILINFTLPKFGVSMPLKYSVYTIVGIAFGITILAIVSSVFMYPVTMARFSILNITIKDINYILGVFLAFLLSTLGITLLNSYNNSFILYIFVMVILLLSLKIHNANQQIYPFVIFFISLSMLYHTALISPYLWGRDIFNELYVSHVILNTGIWIPGFTKDPLNSAVSITVLPIIFSHILQIPIFQVFKVIYPVFFSMSWVVFYELYSRRFNPSIALWAVLLIIFSKTFYAEIPQMARVMIGEFFLSLSLLALFEKEYGFVILFGTSLLMTHYSTFYFFLMTLFFIFFIMTIIYSLEDKDTHFTLSRLVGILITLWAFSTLWFSIFSQGFVFKKAVTYIYSTFESIVFVVMNLFYNGNIYPKTSPIHMMELRFPFLIDIIKYANSILIIGLLIGLIAEFKQSIKIKKANFEQIYQVIYFRSLGITALALTIIFIVVPTVSRSITATRVYHFILILSAPFIVRGMLSLVEFFTRNSKHAISLFLATFLLINSGMLASFTVTPYDDSSISFQSQSDWPKFNEAEIMAANWISLFWDTSNIRTLYGDVYGWVLPGGFRWTSCRMFPRDLILAKDMKAYIFLRGWNTETGTMLVGGGRLSGGYYISTKYIEKYLDEKIYTNTISEIYLYY